MEQVDKFLTRMYRTDPDFVFTVSRDFVRQCKTPVLIMRFQGRQQQSPLRE